jgi:hypothetical protein
MRLFAFLLFFVCCFPSVFCQSLGLTFFNSTNCNSTLPGLQSASATYSASKVQSEALQALVIGFDCGVAPSGIQAVGGVRVRASCILPNAGGLQGSLTLFPDTACSSSAPAQTAFSSSTSLCLSYVSGPLNQLRSVSLTCDSSAFRSFHCLSFVFLAFLLIFSLSISNFL